jgi:colicin import membrane protein
MERVQDWLARSNRDYQGKIVKGLSTPSTAPAEAEDAIARKIEETKAAEAKKAAEEDAAKKAEAAKAADDAKTAAAEKQAADAKAREQKPIEDARKKAEETKRLADEGFNLQPTVHPRRLRRRRPRHSRRMMPNASAAKPSVRRMRKSGPTRRARPKRRDRRRPSAKRPKRGRLRPHAPPKTSAAVPKRQTLRNTAPVRSY